MSCAIQASCRESSGDGNELRTTMLMAPWRDSQNDPYASSIGFLVQCDMPYVTDHSDDWEPFPG